MSNKSMSDVLNEAHQKRLKAQEERTSPNIAAHVPFDPKQAYANQLPLGSMKPRNKRR